MSRHVLVARQDSVGDVLLAGPTVRAVAAGAGRVTLLCGPRGRAAGALLPGVDEVVVAHAAWIDAAPRPVTRAAVDELVDRLVGLEVDQALVLTSFHQSPLPLALLLRMAEVPTIAAISIDYPGSLLDVRHRVDDDLHEVERGLSLAATLGYRLADGDDGRLRVRRHPAADLPDLGDGPYVVVHPGASAPARAWAPERHGALVGALVAGGRRVVVTGDAGERRLTATVAGAAAGGPGNPEGVPRWIRWSTWVGRSTWPGWPRCWPGPRWWWSATLGRRTWRRRWGRPWCRCSRRWCRPSAGGPGGAAGAAGRPAGGLRGVAGPGLPRARPSLPRRGAGLRGRRRGRPAGVPADEAGGVREPEGCPGGSRGGGMRVLLWHVHGSWTTAFVQGATSTWSR